ncbi:ABC-2 transporter permease [Butyricicoccus pullicaecorum]|uniref:ABC-2 transporter permease n=1 Tax=Butyricicoccus pullicaecorum TaxID=501571 RepID=UPI003521FBDC
MRALLLKDILALKRTLRIYAAFLVVYCGIGIFSDNPSFFMVFITVLSIMLPINAMTIDKGCHWNAYSACLPIPRSMSVLSKYVLAGLGILAAIIPCLVFRLVDRYTSLITDTISWSEIALMTALALTILAFQMPFLFRFGPERGRFASMAALLLLCIGLPMIVMQGGMDALTQTLHSDFLLELLGWVGSRMWVLIVIALALNVLSAVISILIVNRHDVD